MEEIRNQKTYLRSKSRHIRLLFFISDQIGEGSLLKLMRLNIDLWGGRYNPIIPVTQTGLEDKWLNVIENLDPDYIYYSDKINIEHLKHLNFFHPEKYKSFKEENPHSLPGIFCDSLISIGFDQLPFGLYSSVITESWDWAKDRPMVDFYRLNLGFRDFMVPSKFIPAHIDKALIEKQTDITEIIFLKKPLHRIILSQIEISSILLTPENAFEYENFEWIIYNNDTFLYDLLYFWNRQLYFKSSYYLRQIITSTIELELLLEQKSLEALVGTLSFGTRIKVTSTSLAENDLKDFRNRIQKICPGRQLVCSTTKFPYVIERCSQQQPVKDKSQTNLLLGTKDIFPLPPLPFSKIQDDSPEKYAVDVLFQREDNHKHTEVKFPYGTETYHLLTKTPARINKTNRISLFPTVNMTIAEFRVPSDETILTSLLRSRIIHGEHAFLPIELTAVSSAGKKLFALYNLFEKNLGMIEDFLRERFWVHLFKFDSEVKKDSNIPGGRSVFSIQDIKSEIDLLFQKYKEQMLKKEAVSQESPVEEETLLIRINGHKQELFQRHIEPNLNYLIQRGAMFMGMKVSCYNCGSNLWYSLNDLGDSIACKGCKNTIRPDLSSKVYYKLNDIILNNMLSDTTGRGKEFDGNYVVLKTLIHLKNTSANKETVRWLPSVDFISTIPGEHLASDIDIVAIQDGKLILGEAKATANQFNKNEIDQLVWLADNLNPDAIILASISGNLKEKADKVRNLKKNGHVKVIEYIVSSPHYYLPGLHSID